MLKALNGVSVSDTSGNKLATISTETLVVELDSGTALTYLPQRVIDPLFAKIGAQHIDGVSFVKCSVVNDIGSIDFDFSDTTIKVPASFLGAPVANGPHGFDCQFLVNLSKDDPILLGDSMMRAMYIVYDLNCKTISIAQAKFNVTDSKILEIQPSCPSVPGANPAGNVQNVTVPANATGLGALNGPDRATSKAGKPTPVVSGRPNSSGNASITMVSGVQMTTSTFKVTSTIVVTSCSATVISCPTGSTITTQTVHTSTTICPVSSVLPAVPSTTGSSVKPSFASGSSLISSSS